MVVDARVDGGLLVQEELDTLVFGSFEHGIVLVDRADGIEDGLQALGMVDIGHLQRVVDVSGEEGQQISSSPRPERL